MNAQLFKTKVLEWLLENNVDIGNKKVRVFNSRRYGLEVRVYNEPMEFQNTKRSRRKMPVDENGNNCMVGIFSRKIATYTHINESDFEKEEERKFILECFKNN